ncbi:hypothetical protein DD238_003215 [Peronospora effusa]|uniref:TIGR01456 family HAD hydrolase n=1 Tax=Peronospora effusa TaxID=542832 RepID=A0A3M6VMQ2_9STRA|nr:hypothetical protein DD238_003215 [Peronospora effusa]
MSWSLMLRSISRRSSRAFSIVAARSTASLCAPSFGIAFDIDGVFIRGDHALPKAKQVLQSLEKNKVPYIFLTNGGGCMEEDKAKNLSRILDWPIHSDHMILSHTPMRELAKIYAHKRVLVMGSHDVWRVRSSLGSLLLRSFVLLQAECYGFKKVTYCTIIRRSIHSSITIKGTDFIVLVFETWFCHTMMDMSVVVLVGSAPHHDEPIEAIIVMHDPINWAPEIQVAVDVLVGGDPPGSGRPSGKQIPLFLSNDDFVFSGAYPAPRFAQGAFTRCLKLLYEDLTGRKLDVTNYGKPYKVTYNYAQSLLNTVSGQGEPLKHLYGIGDNPQADIQGANNAGDEWTSVLVRTGIYDGSSDPEHEADVVVDDVYDAIKHIYKCEGINDSTL